MLLAGRAPGADGERMAARPAAAAAPASPLAADDGPVVGDVVELLGAPLAGEEDLVIPEDDLARRSETPDLILTTAAGRNVSLKNSSARLQATWTGLPVILARRAAWTACGLAVLPPNPPPTKGVMTWTFCGREPEGLGDARPWSRNGDLVEDQTVALSPSTLTRAVWVSMRGMGDVAVEIAFLDGERGQLGPFLEIAALGDGPALPAPP